MPHNAGYIYAITSEGTPYVKIGMTMKPEERLREMTRRLQRPARLMAQVAVKRHLRAVEYALHFLLHAVRYSGADLPHSQEWFAIPHDEEGFAPLVDRAIQLDKQFQSFFLVRLTTLRDMCGWTLQEVATITGLHPSMVGHIFSGTRVRPTPETVRRLAHAFGTTTDYLLGMDVFVSDDEEEHEHAA